MGLEIKPYTLKSCVGFFVPGFVGPRGGPKGSRTLWRGCTLDAYKNSDHFKWLPTLEEGNHLRGQNVPAFLLEKMRN